MMGYDVNKRGFDPDDYRVAARMGGIKIETIDPLKEKEANRVAVKIGFREFTENLTKKIAKAFSVPAETLTGDRFLYSQYRHMWE